MKIVCACERVLFELPNPPAETKDVRITERITLLLLIDNTARPGDLIFQAWCPACDLAAIEVRRVE